MSDDAAPDAPADPSPEPDRTWPTEARVELVLRSLRGEVLADLAQETGRPRKQLSSWRTRFLAAGTAALDGREPEEVAALRAGHAELAARVDQLESENLVLDRQLGFIRSSRPDRPHPMTTLPYAESFLEPGVEILPVPPWGTSVLVRTAPTGRRQATGLRPIAVIDPGADLVGGLELIGAADVDSISLVTDPLWCPEHAALDEAFDACRPFKENHIIDRRAAPVHLRKRVRNIVNGARRVTEVHEVALADTIDRWLELYAINVANRQITQPFSEEYFRMLIDLPGLSTVAVMHEGAIVNMTTWIRHNDILYYLDGASNDTGFELSASYAAFAHVIDTTPSCRFIFLGGSSQFRDDPNDGLAVFKRGFANTSAMSYLCRANTGRDRAPAG